VAGEALKAKDGWYWDYKNGKSGNGTDGYGFSALPGGYRDNYKVGFNGAGSLGYWWTATEAGGYAYYRNMDSNSDDVGEYYDSNSYSVRCVKD